MDSLPLLFDGHCFRRADVIRAGASKYAFATAVQDGRIRHLLYGVYVDSRRELDLAARLEAVEMVRPRDAVVGRRTAALLRGIDTAPPGAPACPHVLECIVPPERAPIRRPGIRCYSAPLDGDVEELGGVPCTTAVRTAVDLLRYLPPHLGLAAADALAHEGLVTVSELVRHVERWSGGRNIERARRLAMLCEPKTESPGESWLRLRIVDAGFPRPHVQIPILRNGRLVFRLDLGYPTVKLGIEYDGQEFHTAGQDRLHDARRRAQIEREFGWRILAVGRGEVLGRSLDLERGIGELLGMAPQITRRTW